MTTKTIAKGLFVKKQSEIPEMLPTQEAQRPRFSPVVFDLAPAWLSLSEAERLTRYTRADLLWMIREGMVDAREGAGGTTKVA